MITGSLSGEAAEHGLLFQEPRSLPGTLRAAEGGHDGAPPAGGRNRGPKGQARAAQRAGRAHGPSETARPAPRLGPGSWGGAGGAAAPDARVLHVGSSSNG